MKTWKDKKTDFTFKPKRFLIPEIYMRENGEEGKDMAKENAFIMMDHIMKATGKMINPMEREGGLI